MNWLSDEERSIREFARAFAIGVIAVALMCFVCLFVAGLAHQI